MVRTLTCELNQKISVGPDASVTMTDIIPWRNVSLSVERPEGPTNPNGLIRDMVVRIDADRTVRIMTVFKDRVMLRFTVPTGIRVLAQPVFETETV